MQRKGEQESEREELATKSVKDGKRTATAAPASTGDECKNTQTGDATNFMLVHFKDTEHESGAIPLVIAPANITVQNLKRALKSRITEGNMLRIENNTSKELEIREIQHNVRLTNQRIDDINSEAAMLFKEAFEGR